ncbi:hypothetical protein ACLOJK_026672 [Asimina triloba]
MDTNNGSGQKYKTSVLPAVRDGTNWQEWMPRAAITSTGVKKGDLFLADVNTQLKNKNITTDVKVDTNSNLFTTITVEEPAPGLKTIFRFTVPDQKSGKAELEYLHDFAGVNASFGLTANPIINFATVVGTPTLAAGVDLSFDTGSGNFTKYNAGLNFCSADLIASLTLRETELEAKQLDWGNYRNDKGDNLKASYYHTVRPLTSSAVGAELSHSFTSNENTLTIGTQHALDPLTLVKARINNYGKASTLIQHEWRPKSLITISAEVDTRAIEKNAKVRRGGEKKCDFTCLYGVEGNKMRGQAQQPACFQRPTFYFYWKMEWSTRYFSDLVCLMKRLVDYPDKMGRACYHGCRFGFRYVIWVCHGSIGRQAVGFVWR